MEKTTDADACWSRAAHVACVDSETHFAVLPLDRTPAGAPRILEGAAAVIWRELDAQPKPETEIVAIVAEAFVQIPASIAADVRAFLSDLEAEGLAQRS